MAGSNALFKRVWPAVGLVELEAADNTIGIVCGKS
jgi:hypothetical protein